MRGVSLLLILGLVTATCGWIIAQDGGSGSQAKRPLDLPSGGQGDNDDEEDAPESITFYGSEYEGDGFFWCLDKSCSMGWGGEIQTLKAETTAAIQQLSTRAEFSLVSFASNTDIWSPIPRRAAPATKSAAIAWVNTLAAGGSTCLSAAGVATINIANQSTKRRRQILVLGDGQPFCGGADTSGTALSNITGANYNRIPINTIYISASGAGIAFFQSLASQNGGTFTQVH